MKTILVTGHSGFIGTNICKYLNKKYRIIGLSRSVVPNSNIEQYNFDITDKNKITQLLNEKKVNIVIHLSGKGIVSDCEKDPFNAIKTNSLGTASILESCRNSNIEKIINFETDKVYGEQNILPTNETAKLNPGTPYEFSKSLAFDINDFYRNYYNLKVYSIRPANVLGPDNQGTRLLSIAFNSILSGKQIPVYSSSKEMIRSFIYVKDVCKMLELLLLKENPKHSIYNFSADYDATIYEFVCKVCHILNYNKPPKIIEKQNNFKEIQKQSIDGTRFKDEFNFKFTDFETIVKESFVEHKKLNNYEC